VPPVHDADAKWLDERRKEFRNTIDINHDGKVSRDELMVGQSEGCLPCSMHVQ
jgi:hypothetical protein